jgi:large subunit ribosomal protein L6
MSRVGRSPITIPAGVNVEVVKGGLFNNVNVKVSGPKGALETSVRMPIDVKIEDGKVLVVRPNDEKQSRSFHGLYRALIANMVNGVVTGYKKELEIVGIGYRAEQQGEKVVFSLGYAHKIELFPPQGISITVSDQTNVAVEGIDKELVGKIAAQIRSFRKPEPYKGKGIKYKGEQILRKSVKQG